MESPQLVRYSYLYGKKPSSRVFAPLANCYRKLGMFAEAFEILKKGVAQHPDYVLGYIVLSKCHRDVGEISRAYDVLKYVSHVDPDNFSYKELRADLAYRLDEVDDALKYYQELSDLNSKGNYSSRILDLSSKAKGDEPETYFESKHLSRPAVLESLDAVGDWTHMDFSETRIPISSDSEVSDSFESSELISHTLINLYCEQGHYAKALQIANSLLAEEPGNLEVQSIRDRIIQGRLFEQDVASFEEDDEVSEDHIVQDNEKSLMSEDTNNDELNALSLQLKKFQEKLNFKSAQVRLASHA